MSGETLEFLALLAGCLLAYGIKRIIDKGVMTLLIPLLRRCHLNPLVRWVSWRSDTPKNGADTPTDTHADTWSTETLGDGALVIGKPMSTTIRVPHMVRIGEPGSPDGPPVATPGPEKATKDQIRSWVRMQRADGWTRARILTEGQTLFDVSEATMARRYREATS